MRADAPAPSRGSRLDGPLVAYQHIYWGWLVPLFLFCMPVTLFFVRKSMSWTPAVLVLVALPFSTRAEVMSLLKGSRALQIALLATPLALLFALRSPHPDEAALTLVRTLGIIMFSAANYAILSRVPAWAWPRTAAALAAGVVVMAALVMLPFMKVSGVVYPLGPFHLYLYNRMVVLLALISPVLAVLAFYGLPQRFKMLGAAAVVAATAAMAWLSVSETAKLLSVIAPLLFGLAVYAPRLTAWLTGLGISAGYFLFFPLARWADHWLSQSRLGITPEDYGSAWTRIKIWVKASERAAQNFWFGGGPNMMTANRLGYLGETLPAGHTAHAHSGIAQAWVDLGFVGVVLIVAAVLAGLYAARNFATYHRAAAITVLGLAFVVWAISHGMWQSWFHGMAGFCFAACALCTGPVSGPVSGVGHGPGSRSS